AVRTVDRVPVRGASGPLADARASIGPVADRLECFGDPSRRAVRIFVSRGQALSAGPARPAEILPGTAIHIALRIEGLRTRVFRGIELEHHPLRIRNARIRGRVQKPTVFVREPKVYGSDVIFQLLGLPGGHDYAADRGPAQHPRQRRPSRTYVTPSR